MMDNNNCLCSWSGGKDSCFALMKALEEGYQPKVLLNVLNEEGEISRSHGIPKHIIALQARAVGLPTYLISSSWADYEKNFTQALISLKEEHHLSTAIFGDIDLQAHRDWEEMVCTKVALQAVLPIWKQDRKELVIQMLKQGIKTIIVSCNEQMGSDFLGKQLTTSLIDDLEALGIDVCGENGEFHTLVIDCPLFSFPINVNLVKKKKHNNYWFTILNY